MVLNNDDNALNFVVEQWLSRNWHRIRSCEQGPFDLFHPTIIFDCSPICPRVTTKLDILLGACVCVCVEPQRLIFIT